MGSMSPMPGRPVRVALIDSFDLPVADVDGDLIADLSHGEMMAAIITANNPQAKITRLPVQLPSLEKGLNEDDLRKQLQYVRQQDWSPRGMALFVGRYFRHAIRGDGVCDGIVNAPTKTQSYGCGWSHFLDSTFTAMDHRGFRGT
jgi:hypothetical protein